MKYLLLCKANHRSKVQPALPSQLGKKQLHENFHFGYEGGNHGKDCFKRLSIQSMELSEWHRGLPHYN